LVFSQSRLLSTEGAEKILWKSRYWMGCFVISPLSFFSSVVTPPTDAPPNLLQCRIFINSRSPPVHSFPLRLGSGEICVMGSHYLCPTHYGTTSIFRSSFYWAFSPRISAAIGILLSGSSPPKPAPRLFYCVPNHAPLAFSSILPFFFFCPLCRHGGMSLYIVSQAALLPKPHRLWIRVPLCD